MRVSRVGDEEVEVEKGVVRVHNLTPLRDGQTCVDVATPLPERLRSCLRWWKKHAPRGVVDLLVRVLGARRGTRKGPPSWSGLTQVQSRGVLHTNQHVLLWVRTVLNGNN